MDQLTRRDALRAATAAGLLVAGTTAAVAADDPKPSVEELVKQLRSADEQRRPANVLASQGDPPVLLVHPSDFRAIEPTVALPEVRSILDGSGKHLAYGLTWTLAADKIHNLYINSSTPLKARSITFEYSNIGWQAGLGWPVYHQRCPRDDYGQNFYYPHAKVHAIVHSIGNTYSVGCLESGSFTVNDPDQVRCAVNDGPGDYGDNRGTWSFTLTSWT